MAYYGRFSWNQNQTWQFTIYDVHWIFSDLTRDINPCPPRLATPLEFTVPLASCWNSPALTSHCMTTSWLSAATQVRWRWLNVPSQDYTPDAFLPLPPKLAGLGTGLQYVGFHTLLLAQINARNRNKYKGYSRDTKHLYQSVLTAKHTCTSFHYETYLLEFVLTTKRTCTSF